MTCNDVPEATQKKEAAVPEKGKKGGLWKPVLLLSAVITAMILAKVFGLGDKLGDLKEWIKDLGPLGYLVFVGIYIVATVFALPGSALTVTAGALFGTLIGTSLVSVGSTVGAALCFLIARYFARESMTRSLGNSPKFQKLERLTEKQGGIVVAVTRLVPLFPFNVLNYGFGLTKVRFGTYVLVSWICMLPGTLLYVAGADAVSKGVEGEKPWGAIITVGVIVLMMLIIVPLAKKRLADHSDDLSDQEENT